MRVRRGASRRLLRRAVLAFGWRRRLLAVPILLCASALTACANSAPSPLNPSSPRAEQLNRLWWIFFVMAAVLFVFVVVVLVVGAIRTPSVEEQQRRHPFGTPLLWIGGITIPGLVLATIFVLSTRDLVAVANPAPPQLTIEVTGHQWWWEANYPQQGFITANEIHIPVDTQVLVKLESVDVIHDFWVPEIQGKLDAIPGETNTLTLESNKTGTYRGQCLVYCGLQHANMNFLLVVDSPSDFNNWVNQQKAAAAQPSDPAAARGAQLFVSSSCVYCHAVSGTQAQARVGPDLTHFGSRQQIGAGVMPNNADNLAAWIRNPQASKPGALMPAESFSDADLNALVAYLESLK